MRCLAVALALTGTHGFMSHKLPATPMRGAATQLTMRLGNGGGGTRRGGFTGRLGAGWKKGIVPRGRTPRRRRTRSTQRDVEWSAVLSADASW